MYNWIPASSFSFSVLGSFSPPRYYDICCSGSLLAILYL